ncbi:hypothetical protein CDO47_27435 [Pseudomonas aeruginosa]|nr:hypothetical protein CDO47_27435 [Pseudomonas aeruginosa]
MILDISHHQHFLQRMRQLIWLTMSLSALATALLGAWPAPTGSWSARSTGACVAGSAGDD